MLAQDIQSLVLVAPLALLLLSGAWVLVFGARFGKTVPWLISLMALSPAVVGLRVLPFVMRGNTVSCTLKEVLPPLGMSFRVDELGLLMLLLIGVFGFLVVIYSLEYESRDIKRNRFFAFELFALTGLTGVILAGDLFTLFLFFEAMSLCLVVLITQSEETHSYAASMKFLFYTIVAGVSIFLGVAIILYLTGTLSLAEKGVVQSQTPLAFLGFMCFALGFGIKAGMVPLHMWLPDAHANAPSPASALLSGLSIKTGAYSLIRVFYHIYGVSFLRETGWNKIILALAVVNILLGSAAAIAQVNLKRRLAYSSIAQIGYVLLGLSLLSPAGLIGAIYHIFTHCLMKGGLFLCAGSILHTANRRMIPDLKGIGWEMPVTMAGFTVAALTIVGLPPLNAFVSKWHLSLGALETDMPLLVLLLLVSSLMNAAYYFPIVTAAFWGKRGATFTWKDSPSVMLIPLVLLALGCIAFTLAPLNWPLVLTEKAVRCLFGP